MARFGLDAAFLCFTVLVGITLLPALCLPMKVLSAGKGGADGSQAGRGTRDGSARLSCLGGSEAKLGQGSEEGGSLSVHISGASQTAAQERGGHKAGPALGGQPLGKSWSIGASLAAAGAVADLSRSPQPISLVADCRGTAAAADVLASPQRPLLAAADHCDSPCPPPAAILPAGAQAVATTTTTSPLEISAAAGSKARLAVPPTATSASPAAATGVAQEASVWQGIKQLFADVHVAAFMFTAFLMGIGNGAIG